MKRLPVGVSNFEKIIRNNDTYVDKTAILYELIRDPRAYFLSRPRRFGKSLTCSTLEAIFSGKRELFDGLAINDINYDWQPYPVIKLDFNGITHKTIADLEEALQAEFARIAAYYTIKSPNAVSTDEQFKDLLYTIIDKQGPVVIIIDEYDKPITDHIGNNELAQQMRTFMKSFYGILKGSHVEAHLRFLFMTGVTKFSKISIFSELNNLDDLTLDERTATLCGYTQEELELVFGDHITTLAEHTNTPKAQILDKLKDWYNGYQFSDIGAKVYNPFSVLNCLTKKKFSNYWFASGTPTFIPYVVQQNPSAVQQLMTLETEQITISQMDTLSLETYFQNMALLFLQAGYLTITSFDEASHIYQLAYPNYEVRLSMTDQILELVAHINAVQTAGFAVRFRNALTADDIQAFCATMKDFFALLPHTIIVHREKFYQGAFFIITKLIGAHIDAEQATSRGFIDAVLDGHKNTYIIEFKRDKTPDNALQQIHDKYYHEKFMIDSTKPVVLVGMNFEYSDETGVSVSWNIEKL